MLVLALDTCLDVCAAAVLRNGKAAAVRSIPMQRGHQEALGPLVAAVMDEAEARFESLDRVGVTVGPGSFTGLRIGLAFAKGLAFARALPLAGIGVLPALAASGGKGRVAAVIDARKGEVYFQPFLNGEPMAEARVTGVADAASVVDQDWTLVGSGAVLLGKGRVLPLVAPDPIEVARLAAASPEPLSLARPIYIRPPYAGWPTA